jgi:phage terminase large subunit-like protein
MRRRVRYLITWGSQVIDHSTLRRALEDSWRRRARPEQLPPDEDWWTIFLFLGGRGSGKTRSINEFALSEIAKGTARRLAIVGATANDTRAILVEGESGILSIAPAWNRPHYAPGLRRLTWKNGASAHLYSADEPERLRGPNHDLAIVDELCAWRRPSAFDQLMFTLRLPGKCPPRVAIATTPKPTRLLRELLAREGKDVFVSRSTSYQNRANWRRPSLSRSSASTRTPALGARSSMQSSWRMLRARCGTAVCWTSNGATKRRRCVESSLGSIQRQCREQRGRGGHRGLRARRGGFRLGSGG